MRTNLTSRSRLPYARGVKILVATDGSLASRAAVRFAATLAARSRRGRLIAVAVGSPSARPYRKATRLPLELPAETNGEGRRSTQRILDIAQRDAERLGARALCRYVGTRDLEPIAEVIARTAEREHADLVVVGSGGGTELARWALGSITHRLVHLARRPVAVVRVGAKAIRRPLRILAATDGSKSSLEAVSFAARLAAAIPRSRLAVVNVSTLAADVTFTGAPLMRALGVLPELDRADREAGAAILNNAAAATRRFGKRVALVYRRPRRPISAGATIVREAGLQRADLIVLGNTGRSAVNDLLFGSVAQRVLGLSHRPVALVPARTRGRA
jgi:nucleotide-binding universal stress UspA family protein